MKRKDKKQEYHISPLMFTIYTYLVSFLLGLIIFIGFLFW